MASKREREVLLQAADDGDALAAAQLRDIDEEDGLPPFWKPKRGDWIVIFTGAFFHNGQLLGEDHECYCLAPGSEQIFETGDFRVFYGEGVCTNCETIPVVASVRKGPTTHVTAWPFRRTVRPAIGRA